MAEHEEWRETLTTPDGTPVVAFMAYRLGQFLADDAGGMLDVTMHGDSFNATILMTPNLNAVMRGVELGVNTSQKQSVRVRIDVVPINQGENMASFYRVEDADGERHVVVADNGDQAVDLVQKYLDSVGGSLNQGARPEYLSTETVGGGQVLSGVDPEKAKEDKAKGTTGRTTSK